MTLPDFTDATLAWFQETFPAATPVQRLGWARISAGQHALLLAPTGSGKTLAAFLWAIDRLVRGQGARGSGALGYRVVYISPLKALANDVDRNLRVPLAGITAMAARRGEEVTSVGIDVRTGDTSAAERRRQLREPGDILITTPESLFLILGSQARATLTTVEAVIVDEIHALAPTKRGAHLALSLERLAAIADLDPQRIGLSATQRPLDEIARFLGGDRPVSIVDTSERPALDLSIRYPPPEERTGGPAESPSVWPALYPRLVEQIRAHRTTIVFANGRRLVERLVAAVNEIAGERLVEPHHGSMSHAQRGETEAALKEGRLRGIVATSSLELGIDMGTVDLVVLVESPGSAARGLQRVGRAGHGVGQTSKGILFPKFRGDLLEAAVVARLMREGSIEPTRVPRNVLDVLAQHVVALCATGPQTVDGIERLAHRTYTWSELSRDALVAVLDMLSGRYPTDELADLRPRLVWDRETDVLVARRGAGTVAAINAGTIPDRGLYRVVVGEDGPRIGELDEEMVYESRVGEVFLLGASSWRILAIERDRVVVEPAPGEPGKMPFWKGDAPGRPVELGREVGALVRHLGELPAGRAEEWLRGEQHLDPAAAAELVAYVEEQREATGTLPTDRAITVERFRDEVGDWRVAILSPFGGRVHAPWALAIDAALGDRAGVAVQTLWSDDGIVLRFADGDEPPSILALLPDPDTVEEAITAQLGRSALFAARFRENAARALLLTRRRPDQRTPLWANRIRAANLLAVASRYPAFPIVLETYRECLRDVFDVPALLELLRGIRGRRIAVDEVETAAASPFSRGLVFAWVAAYLYEGDAPLAERKAQALVLDRALLRELMGGEELRELLDAGDLEAIEAELQGLSRRARNVDDLHDLLRRVGDLTAAEVAARCDVAAQSALGGESPRDPGAAAEDAAVWVAALARQRRAFPMGVAGEDRWVAAEDVARYRDGLGCAIPVGVPTPLLDPVEAALDGLVARFARTHAPFLTSAVAARLGVPPALAEAALRRLEAAGRLLHGDFRPGGVEREWCDPDVLRQARRRSLARLRREVAPVDEVALARFIPRWMGATARRGSGALLEVVARLQGLALPFSELERHVLPARVECQPRHLDELGASGQVVWLGRGALGTDGRVALYLRDRVHLLAPDPGPFTPQSVLHEAIHAHLARAGASFFSDLVRAAPPVPEADLVAALWDLVWEGRVTNDTLAPLRALGARRGPGRAGAAATRKAASGRWSLTRDLIGGAETERAHARATLLLDRWGVLAREVAAVEDLPGGFAALYPILRAMEESGRIRRGHFAEGLTGAQFALAGAIDRLRSCSEPSGDAVCLCAVDPANPFGAILPWPPLPPEAPAPRRAAGTLVVLVEGRCTLTLDRGGRLLDFTPPGEAPPDSAAGALVQGLARRRGLARIDEINGEPVGPSALVGALRGAGFSQDHRGLALERRVP
ncbi:MAG: DEAD/DEAH box helicase [Myxococcales bacterium]